MKNLTPYQSYSINAGLLSSVILKQNLIRTGLVLINLSTNNISFGLGVDAVLGAGITLTPNGVWEMDEYTYFNGTINAISSAANSPISVQEFA